jgi:hypothetical protein
VTSGHRHRMPADQIPAETGWNPAMVRSRPDLAKMARIQPLIRSDLGKMAEIRLDLAKMVGIQPDLTGSRGVRQESGQTCSPESGNGDRTLPDSGNSCIFASRNFFVRTKCRKIFWRKSFFLKMISLKIFYDGNHFTSKQTKHNTLLIGQSIAIS